MKEEVVTYDVGGATAAALRAELDQKGPVDDFGRHDALTKWFVRWSYDYERGDGTRCSLANVKATVVTTITLPKWTVESPPELVTEWAAYVGALKTHERGHADNAIDTARFVVEAITALPAAADCDVASTVANAAGDRELDLAHERDRAYDAETDHGATQGARFH